MTSEADTRRPRGRPRKAEIMSQISIRVPAWMLEEIDDVIHEDRAGISDRATIIREAVVAFLDERKRNL